MKILENCPDLSPEWLLTGKGQMIISDLEIEPIKKPSLEVFCDGFFKFFILYLFKSITAKGGGGLEN